MIKLVDARKGLHEKCVELFHNEKVAENIYMYLCDGIEECDAVKPEQKNGKWLDPSLEGIVSYSSAYAECSECGKKIFFGRMMNFCPNCGSYNGGEQE